jgi:hypothetical protein
MIYKKAKENLTWKKPVDEESTNLFEQLPNETFSMSREEKELIIAFRNLIKSN